MLYDSSCCLLSTMHLAWARGGAVGCGTALQAGRSRVRFPTVSLEFLIDIILPDALTEMSTGNISWGKGGRCVGLTTLSPSSADCLATCWNPLALSRPVMALLYLCT
jgi:hypothetical protein